MSTKEDEQSTHSESMEAMRAEFSKIVAQNQKTLTKLMSAPQETIANMLDPMNALGSFVEGAKQLTSNPDKLIKANMDLWQQHLDLWQQATNKMLGVETDPIAETDKGDRRFKAKEWEENQLFDFIRQSYLITSRWLTNTMSDIDGLSEEDARKVQFHTQQLTNAFSPSNFLLTDPQVIKETVASGGKNLIRGMQNLRRDLECIFRRS